MIMEQQLPFGSGLIADHHSHRQTWLQHDKTELGLTSKVLYEVVKSIRAGFESDSGNKVGPETWPSLEENRIDIAVGQGRRLLLIPL